MFEYETLKIIWWLFVGVLLIGFAITDGFDLGIGALLPFLGKNDSERRVIINAIGPTWDGNQVWFVTAGGALFAAWPTVYATAFSGFYWALLLVLFALFFRPVGFDYRSKVPDPRWRTAWDWGLFIGGLVPAFVFGVAFGNLFLGVPFHYDEHMRPFYTGSFWQLLSPFALLSGVVSLSMLIMHGAVFLSIKTEGEIQHRARKTVRISSGIFLAAFALAGVWLATGIEAFKVVHMPDTNTTPDILAKSVEHTGSWLANYGEYPWMLSAPVLALLGPIIVNFLVSRNKPGRAFIFSSITLAGVILTAGFSLFPFILPSISDPKSSLLMWDAVSSHLTLTWMFWAVVFFLPIIILYTSWVYHIMRGKVTKARVEENSRSMY